MSATDVIDCGCLANRVTDSAYGRKSCNSIVALLSKHIYIDHPTYETV